MKEGYRTTISKGAVEDVKLKDKISESVKTTTWDKGNEVISWQDAHQHAEREELSRCKGTGSCTYLNRDQDEPGDVACQVGCLEDPRCGTCTRYWWSSGSRNSEAKLIEEVD